MCQGTNNNNSSANKKNTQASTEPPEEIGFQQRISSSNYRTNGKEVSFVIESENHQPRQENAQPSVLKTSTLSREEIHELWYTKEDLESTRKDIVEILKILKRSKSLPLNNTSATSSQKGSLLRKKARNKVEKEVVCGRGLERQLDRSRHSNRIRTYKSFREEQERQSFVGINDADKLAEVYTMKSYWAKQLALEQAQQDCEDAKQALNEIADIDDTKPMKKKRNNGRIKDLLNLSRHSTSSTSSTSSTTSSESSVSTDNEKGDDSMYHRRRRFRSSFNTGIKPKKRTSIDTA